MNDKKDRIEKVFSLLEEFYQDIDEAFLGYFISLSGPQTWRPKLHEYVQEYKHLWIEEIGLSEEEAEKRTQEADFMFGDSEFRLYTTTSKLQRLLSVGVFEDIQAKNTIKLIYDSWDNTYRPQLEKLIGKKIQGNIWGDLRYLRNSIAHRNSLGVDDIKKAKLINNFAPNQKIILTHEIMSKIQYEIQNWYTEFQLKYRADLNIKSVKCRTPIPSGKARTYGLTCLKSFIEQQKFGIKHLSKKNLDSLCNKYEGRYD